MKEPHNQQAEIVLIASLAQTHRLSSHKHTCYKPNQQQQLLPPQTLMYTSCPSLSTHSQQRPRHEHTLLPPPAGLLSPTYSRNNQTARQGAVVWLPDTAKHKTGSITTHQQPTESRYTAPHSPQRFTLLCCDCMLAPSLQLCLQNSLSSMPGLDGHAAYVQHPAPQLCY